METIELREDQLWCYRGGEIVTHRECVRRQIRTNEYEEGGLCTRCPVGPVAQARVGIFLGAPGAVS
jgi:hypothetical protein